jgi:hypothetical protein
MKDNDINQWRLRGGDDGYYSPLVTAEAAQRRLYLNG